jgi:hypothetical protein
MTWRMPTRIDATPGIPLPQHRRTQQMALPLESSFLFADVFFGAAECPGDLQRGVDAARAWCLVL